MTLLKKVMKRCLGCFVLSIFIFLSCVECSAEDLTDSNLYSASAVLMDASNCRVLYGKNSKEIRPMASTTKVMTCIIALENASLDTVAQISEYAASMPEVSMGIKEGEKYYLKDLLYAMMLESYNDTSVAIAEAVSGSEEKFLELMNNKAKEIGCQNTSFLTTNGLDKSLTDMQGKVQTHSTTAEDLARIMAYCINSSEKSDIFLQITQTMEYSLNDIENEKTFHCRNHNSFLNMMEGVISGKTGFTVDAGYCYIGALEQNNKKFIVALLASGWPNNKNYKWKDAKRLMKYGLDNFDYQAIEMPCDSFTFDIDNGVYDFFSDKGSWVIGSVSKDDDKVLISKKDKIRYEVEIEKKVVAPVYKGQELGCIKCFIGEELYKTFPILSEKNIEKKTFGWSIKIIISHLFD